MSADSALIAPSLGCSGGMNTNELVAEVRALRAATVEQMDELPLHDVPERASLQGRRDAFDEVLILLGVGVGG